MGDTMSYEGVCDSSFADTFMSALNKKDEVHNAIFRASEIASIFDWTFEGICFYFSRPFAACWPIVANMESLTRYHKKPILPEWLSDSGLMEILESGKARQSSEEKRATELIFQSYLTLISALQNGELIAKGRESALAEAVEVPASLWSSEFSYVSLRKNELLRVDGDEWQVLAEDLTIFAAPYSKTKHRPKSENEGRFVEANVIRYLEALEGQIRKPKADIKKEALQRFPGLSGREFDRLWAKYAPKRFTQSGRISLKEAEV